MLIDTSTQQRESSEPQRESSLPDQFNAPIFDPPDQTTVPGPDPAPTPLCRSMQICHAPECFSFEAIPHVAKHAITSFATFVTSSNSNHQNDVYHTADHVTETFNFCDPIIFQAMTKNKDPDLPTYHEALTGYDHEGFYKAMGKEICELDSKNMWTICKCSKMNQQN